MFVHITILFFFFLNEIENLLQEMLKATIIQPITSAFSSSVLLVKHRKEGSWCFRINYRALNNSTIKDPFLYLQSMSF